MRITPEMLIEAFRAGDYGIAWMRIDSDDPGEICLDGWFDLAKMAEALNAELIKQAQTSEPVGMLDLNVTAWKET
jgi:hypothetical protein